MPNDNPAGAMLNIVNQLELMRSLLEGIKDEIQELRKALERQTSEMQHSTPSRING